ncbi:NIPSNAP family protein [Sphingomonas sp. Y38-1Y]|uniref:NIPSNAP family protein n=1 Tax=Sphingomonas sp. Y38-1Y TaxID=3078265 RepID=UPI0028E5F969|nr:NIPSNAP family protein [Sphingomonas sp. Y38-1Y]
MIVALIPLAIAQAAPALDPKTATYELRIYHAAPGKLDALNARFRGHTLKLFERHGMKNVAYWVEQPNEKSPGGRVVYVLAYPSRAARDASWAAFGADPEWKKVAAASEANGKLVEKVDSIFMTQADYSPAIRF